MTNEGCAGSATFGKWPVQRAKTHHKRTTIFVAIIFVCSFFFENNRNKIQPIGDGRHVPGSILQLRSFIMVTWAAVFWWRPRNDGSHYGAVRIFAVVLENNMNKVRSRWLGTIHHLYLARALSVICIQLVRHLPYNRDTIYLCILAGGVVFPSARICLQV